MSTERIALIEALAGKALWLSNWMIHHANHLRPNPDGVKVGGHQASSASMTAILSALYFGILKPEDRVAVKPHAAPVFHAIQYLFGKQSLEKLKAFRGYGGAQSYPSRTKDSDDVDISTGSVGLGVAFTAFASMIQDYVRAKPWANKRAEGRMIALVGDAELDEGNVYECLLEGWKHSLRNTWWIIDYNRQSLDGVVREGLYDRIEAIFRAFEWNVVTLKYGAKQRRAFAEPGGERLREWIDACPNAVYSALMFRGGAAWRERLTDEIGDQGKVSALLERRSDAELADLMANLGGHCIESLLEQFEGQTTDKPTVFIAYTVKGWGTPLAGHKDNHAGQMTGAQIESLKASMQVRDGHEWERFEGLKPSERQLQAFLDNDVPFNTTKSRRLSSPAVPALGPQFVGPGATSTQTAFGKILDAYAKTDSELARRIVTTSPDVTVSTNLGTWVNRRHLFANREMADIFQKERIPSAQKWQFTPDGQHIELGIAEMNLFLLLGAAGLSHSLFGERLLPIGTLYDPFIARGLDALNYACYQDARFLLVATPSGVSLAGEGGAHQSVGTPLIGMAQDGLASFEPAFADELSVIIDWGFDYMQRDGSDRADLADWPRDVSGGSVYLRLSTRSIEQPPREVTPQLASDIIRGAYWLVPPTPNCEAIIAYQGVLASEAITAAGMIGGERRNVAVLAVTSADRLNAGWHGAQRARLHGDRDATCHIETLLADAPDSAALVTAIDGHPATLGWLGSVRGHRAITLGVEHFGQTGTVTDLYRHFGIDAAAIANAAQSLFGGRR